MDHLENDGDIVRGLGLVTLHSAYAEEEVDNILYGIESIESYTEKMHKWPISKKLLHVQELLTRFPSSHIAITADLINKGFALFEKRNELVHGRIYAGIAGRDDLYSGRPGVEKREVTADELYYLANDFEIYWEALFEQHIFVLPKAIAALGGGVS